MLGRISVLGLATVFLATGLSGSGTALPIAPLNKAQIDQTSNVIEVAQKKGGKGGGGQARAAKPRAAKAATAKRHAAPKRHVNKVAKVHKTKTVVKRNVVVHRTVIHRPYRAWRHRPYYGVLIGGVALGTVILVSTPRVVPIAPDPALCWYWANPEQLNGYWDYCTPPL